MAIAGTNTAQNTALSGLAENDGAFSVADDATVTTTVNLNNTANIYVDSSDGESGAVLTIGGTLTNSGTLYMGTNVESGSTTVNVEGAGGVNNTGAIYLSDDRSPGTTNQATLDVANAAAGFGIAGQVTGTVGLDWRFADRIRERRHHEGGRGRNIGACRRRVAVGDRRHEHGRQHGAERVRRERRRLLDRRRRDGHDDSQLEQHRQYLRRQF